MPLHHDEVKAVGQGELGDLLFEFLQILARKKRGTRQQDDAETKRSHVVFRHSCTSLRIPGCPKTSVAASSPVGAAAARGLRRSRARRRVPVLRTSIGVKPRMSRLTRGALCRVTYCQLSSTCA